MEKIIVYKRKVFKTPKNNIDDKNNDETNVIPTTTATTTATVNDNSYNSEKQCNNNINDDNISNVNVTVTTNTTTVTGATTTNDQGENNKKGSNGSNGDNKERSNENKSIQLQSEPQALAYEDTNSAVSVQEQPVVLVDVGSIDSSDLVKQQNVTLVGEQGDLVAANGIVKQGLGNSVKINLLSKSKQEMRELRRKLEIELDTVRNLMKRIEAKEGQLGVGRLSNSLLLANDGLNDGAKKIDSKVGPVGVPCETAVPIPTPTLRQSRPLNQLRISVHQNNQSLAEHVEKEKRTPKANQFYRNSEFLLAKDKFPSAESNKKSKLNVKKISGRQSGHAFGTGTKMFKNFSALLEKLMRHRHGWVFNTPVDVETLGLTDYFTIIKHPMDLGTVKSRLNKNWYKSPEEFAEDVRLTFHNALRYNPKGQDVHIMAEELLNVFEDRWAAIKSDYDHEMRFPASYEVRIPTPTSRKANPLSMPHLDVGRILDRSESMTYTPRDARLKLTSTTPSGRTRTPKKPKAKDPNKRDMTYEEKQKLSTNLQNLPSDKLDNIAQIVKKRNSAFSQNDDEIEVDIDKVDVETLWELDRFVTNYKKSLSKYKRKAELAMRARAEAEQNVQKKISVPVAADVPKESKIADERNVSASSPVHMEKQGDNGSRSSSSSSSSSDSGSSSSDSDSDSSSASGSDVGQ